MNNCEYNNSIHLVKLIARIRYAMVSYLKFYKVDNSSSGVVWISDNWL